MAQLGPRGRFEQRFGGGGARGPRPAPPTSTVNGTRPPRGRPTQPAPPAPTGPRPGVAGPTPNGGRGNSAGAATGGHPARRAELRTGSDVLRLCETVRAHEMGGADAMREKAQEAYRGIVKSSNWPFGINKRVAAVRVRRSLRKVANSLELSARSAAAARKTWTDVVGSTQKLGKPSGFDPTR